MYVCVYVCMYVCMAGVSSPNPPTLSWSQSGIWPADAPRKRPMGGWNYLGPGCRPRIAGIKIPAYAGRQAKIPACVLGTTSRGSSPFASSDAALLVARPLHSGKDSVRGDNKKYVCMYVCMYVCIQLPSAIPPPCLRCWTGR